MGRGSIVKSSAFDSTSEPSLKCTCCKMPPTCEWTVTVEYAITCPTGGGSICTGTLVVTALATSTGALAVPFGAPPEQPPASTAAAIASTIGIKKFFFMFPCVADLILTKSCVWSLKSRCEFFQESGALLLKCGIGNRPTHDEPGQLRKRRREHGQ